jgi:hypothetical protein
MYAAIPDPHLTCSVVGMARLPLNLYNLLVDSAILFVGCGVGGDVSKIARDFHAPQVKEHARTVELGAYARRRGFTSTGAVGLQHLAKVVLNQQLQKQGSPRISSWSTSELSQEQVCHPLLR